MSDVTVSVPPRDQALFWRTAPTRSWIWGWRRDPSVSVGDKIHFKMQRRVVASATILAVFPPGCAPPDWRTQMWRVIWAEGSFDDLRDLGEGFVPRLYGGYLWDDEPRAGLQNEP